MNQEQAEEIRRLLVDANSCMYRIADLSHEKFSGEEKKVWVHHVGQVLGEIYFEIIEPVMAEYPELFPELSALRNSVRRTRSEAQ